MPNQHVTPRKNNTGNITGWRIIGEGNSKATKIVNTQQQATIIAKEIAKNQQTELFIHGRDNYFRERNSYGNDPKSTRG